MTEEHGSDAPETGADAEDQADETKPTETVEFWKQKAREQEKRAKANAEAAQKLAEIEEANKTEAQRQGEALAAARAEAEEARAEALRLRIATRHGITDADDIELFLTGTDEETLTRQAERLAERDESAGKPRAPKPDPNQGRDTSGTATPEDQFAAAFKGRI